MTIAAKYHPGARGTVLAAGGPRPATIVEVVTRSHVGPDGRVKTVVFYGVAYPDGDSEVITKVSEASGAFRPE